MFTDVRECDTQPVYNAAWHKIISKNRNWHKIRIQYDSKLTWVPISYLWWCHCRISLSPVLALCHVLHHLSVQTQKCHLSTPSHQHLGLWMLTNWLKPNLGLHYQTTVVAIHNKQAPVHCKWNLNYSKVSKT